MNVGATKPEEYGLYFAWGETQGYTASQVGTDKQFSWDDYNHGTFHDITKYNEADGKTMLELEDDAANANWGGQWRMPTKEQCEELFNTTYVTNKWVTDYNDSGVNGRLFTSVSNGKTLFIPAAGYCDKGRVLEVNSIGQVFSSSLGSTYNSGAYCILFGNRGLPGVDTTARYCGQSVRPVVG